LTVRDYKRYYTYPIEFDATIWGCEFINSNIELVKNLIDGLSPLILSFYIKNGVEID